MIRKVLIMNKNEYGKEETCGLLSLEENTTLNGRLRIYNLDCYDNLVLSLKIGENKLVFSDVSNPENFLFSTIFHNLDAPICAVVASVKNGKVHICAAGHSENDVQNPESLFDDFSDDKTLNEIKYMIDEEIKKQETIDEKLNNNFENLNIDDDFEKTASNENNYSQNVDKIFENDKKDEFFDNTSNDRKLKNDNDTNDNDKLLKNLKNLENVSENNGENIKDIDAFSIKENENNQNIDEERKDAYFEKNDALSEDKQDFFTLIYPQLNELFSNFPRCEELEQKIEDSKWVNVSAGSQSYVLGEIFEEGQISYICYGMYAKSVNDLPPKHLAKYCQWMPLDIVNPEDDGYWVMYQDAKTGQTLVMDYDP